MRSDTARAVIEHSHGVAGGRGHEELSLAVKFKIYCEFIMYIILHKFNDFD